MFVGLSAPAFILLFLLLTELCLLRGPAQIRHVVVLGTDIQSAILADVTEEQRRVEQRERPLRIRIGSR